MKKSSLYLFLRKIWVAYKLINKQNSYLNTTGFIKSHQHIAPINKNGNPIPWMNYGIVEFLDERLTKDLQMFEYGAGFSTQYFARRVSNITSVEYDKQWEKQVTDMLKDVRNSTLLFETVGTAYINASTKAETKYDVILVDGRERVACSKAGFTALSQKGVLILDDSDREEYQEAFTYAQSIGYKALRFSGLKPFSFVREESTIFYKEGNCLGI